MRTILLLTISLVLIGCGESAPPASAAPISEAATVPAKTISTEPGKSYAEARSAAITAIEIAADKWHAWTTSDSLLQEAANAAAQGDESRAISLADEARIHAELAAVQADREATAWHDNVIGD